MMQWPGQFIGFSPNSCPSIGKQNMFSLYLAACPDVSHSLRLYMLGVTTSVYWRLKYWSLMIPMSVL